MRVVLDSWAVLRYLEGAEPCSSAVSELFDDQRPLMSWISLGEVFSVLSRRLGDSEAAETVTDLRREVDARLPDDGLVLSAARLKAQWPLAYADAFAAALAREVDAEVWTGDPELLRLDAAWRWRDIRA